MTDLPKLSKPANAALLHEGIRTLEDVARRSEGELLAIHGVGPKAIRLLRPVLAEHGLALKADR